MPRYVVVRTVGDLTPEEIEAGSLQAMETADSMPGVAWIRSYLSKAEGKIYCLYEAPDPEMVLEHARRAGLPVDSISQVAVELEPAMFR